MKNTLFAIFLSLSLGTACLSQAQMGEEKTPSREEYLQLMIPVLEEDSARIVTSTQKTQFVANEDIVLDIGLKNTGTKPFGAKFGNDDADYFFDIKVVGPDEEVVAFQASHERRRYGPEIVSWNVQPDESKEARVWLNNLFDLKSVGKYRVTVSKKFRRGTQEVMISSEPLAFELTSAPPLVQWK